MCYFKISCLFCAVCEGLWSEACGGDEGEGGGEDFVLDGGVAWGVGMVGRVIGADARKDCSWKQRRTDWRERHHWMCPLMS